MQSCGSSRLCRISTPSWFQQKPHSSSLVCFSDALSFNLGFALAIIDSIYNGTLWIVNL